MHCLVDMLPRVYTVFLCVTGLVSSILWSSSQRGALDVSNTTIGNRSTTDSIVSRTIISDETCDEGRIQGIVSTLIEARALAELSADASRDAIYDSIDEVLLLGTFRVYRLSWGQRAIIEQRYRGVAAEIARWNQGQIMLACATDQWEPCSFRVGSRHRLIDTHVDANTLVLVRIVIMSLTHHALFFPCPVPRDEDEFAHRHKHTKMARLTEPDADQCPRFFRVYQLGRSQVLLGQLTQMRFINLPPTIDNADDFLNHAANYGRFATGT